MRATAPSWGAVKVLRDPYRDPTGVRDAATMTASWEDILRAKYEILERVGLDRDLVRRVASIMMSWLLFDNRDYSELNSRDRTMVTEYKRVVATVTGTKCLVKCQSQMTTSSTQEYKRMLNPSAHGLFHI